MQRIGFSGTNWTGKSTLIDLLAARSDSEIIRLTSLVSACPYPTGQVQTVDASRWVKNGLQRILDRPIKTQLQLFDRTPIDVITYTLHSAQGDEDKCRDIIDDLLEQIKTFDKIFFAGSSEMWPVDQTIGADGRGFAEQIEQLMCYSIDRYGLDVVYLPWPMTERLKILAPLVTAEQNRKAK